MISQSAVAPERMRTSVKLAASMLVCFSAARQSSELPANAIIASSVRTKSRLGFNEKVESKKAKVESHYGNAERPTSNEDVRELNIFAITNYRRKLRKLWIRRQQYRRPSPCSFGRLMTMMPPRSFPPSPKTLL